MKNSQCHKCGGSGTITKSSMNNDDSFTTSFSPCDCGASLFDKQISSHLVEVGSLDWNIIQYGNNIAIGRNAGYHLIAQKNVIVIGDFTEDEGKDIKDGEIIFKEDYFYFKTPLGAILLEYLKNSSDKDIKDVHKFVLSFIKDIKREGMIYNHVAIGHGEPQWAKNQYSNIVGIGQHKISTQNQEATTHTNPGIGLNDGNWFGNGSRNVIPSFTKQDIDIKNDDLNHNGIVPKSNMIDGGHTPTYGVIDMNFRRLKEIASLNLITSTSILLMVVLSLAYLITNYS